MEAKDLLICPNRIFFAIVGHKVLCEQETDEQDEHTGCTGHIQRTGTCMDEDDLGNGENFVMGTITVDLFTCKSIHKRLSGKQHPSVQLMRSRFQAQSRRLSTACTEYISYVLTATC
jgi:hypothetical protein